ncbi:MAG TPA: hypothetical protein CFH80_03945 [Sulfurospirillum cavolei]|uniref:Uncharacterized protein n=1 Tax=Sulfurospirillum cavolei TaxID=366522 RepID=A0A2D3WEB4_9BACT|nr:MAG TPA: hypothetical protein CFH80_03945 [Sulfurospirillum cavolei]
MIETRFEVPVTINGTVFNVTVRELRPAEKKALEKIGEEQKGLLEEQSAKERKSEENAIALQEAQHALEVTREILTLVELKDKLALFIEIKKIGFEIARLKRERLSLERSDFTKANDALERIFKEKFNFIIGGDNKEALKNTIEECNVSYQSVFAEINAEIEEQTKKKLNASEDGQNK